MPGDDASREQFLYLTTVGRRTGLPREIEIWFVSSDGIYYVLSGAPRHSHWVKNIAKNPRVRVRVGGRTFDATARLLDRRRDAERFQTARRLAREKYGWGDGLPVELMPD